MYLRAIDKYKQLNSDVIKLVSFADTTVGHTGTIYKACGWRDDGRTKKNYHYIKDGKRFHKKKIWDDAMKFGISESKFAASSGYIKVIEDEKIRFIIDI